MILEELYYNDEFEKCLKLLARLGRIDSFEDFKQDVFLEILEEREAKKGDEDISLDRASKIANKVAQRCKADQIKNNTYSLMDEDSIEDEGYASVLWEDHHVLA